MIANVSPCASSADHTLNTLRYSYRIKEKQINHNAEEVGSGRKSSASDVKGIFFMNQPNR